MVAMRMKIFTVRCISHKMVFNNLAPDNLLCLDKEVRKSTPSESHTFKLTVTKFEKNNPFTILLVLSMNISINRIQDLNKY